MYCIDKLESNGHNFQIFYFNENTVLEELNIFNYGYLISARYFAKGLQTQKECEQIIDLCSNDILNRFMAIVDNNQKLYKHFKVQRNFSRNLSQSEVVNGKEFVFYYEVFLNLQLKQD
jgi:hypothetical protein